MPCTIVSENQATPHQEGATHAPKTSQEKSSKTNSNTTCLAQNSQRRRNAQAASDQSIPLCPLVFVLQSRPLHDKRLHREWWVVVAYLFGSSAVPRRPVPCHLCIAIFCLAARSIQIGCSLFPDLLLGQRDVLPATCTERSFNLCCLVSYGRLPPAMSSW